MSQIDSAKKNIDEIQTNIESLSKVQSNREEVIEKIREQHRYYLNKAE